MGIKYRNQQETKDLLANKINELSLSPKEIKIVKYRFYDFSALKKWRSLAEVGIKFNLTRERIRQIEEKAISLINKKSFNNKYDY